MTFEYDFIAPRAALYIITACDLVCVRRTSVLYNIEEFSGTTNQIAREKCVLKRTTSAVYYKLRRVYNNINARVCSAPRTTTFALYNNIVTIWTIIIYYTTREDFSNDFRVALVIIFLKIFASKNIEHYKYAYIKKTVVMCHFEIFAK